MHRHKGWTACRNAASIHEHDDPRLIYEAAGQSVFAISSPTTIAAQMDELVRQIDRSFAQLNRWGAGARG